MLGSLRYCGHATETPIVGSIKQRVTARDIEWRLSWRDWDAVRSRDRTVLKLWALSGRKCRLVRILVVDDNPAVRHYLRALLEQQSTWQVCDEARTGGEALQRVEKKSA